MLASSGACANLGDRVALAVVTGRVRLPLSSRAGLAHCDCPPQERPPSNRFFHLAVAFAPVGCHWGSRSVGAGRVVWERGKRQGKRRWSRRRLVCCLAAFRLAACPIARVHLRPRSGRIRAARWRNNRADRLCGIRHFSQMRLSRRSIHQRRHQERPCEDNYCHVAILHFYSFHFGRSEDWPKRVPPKASKVITLQKIENAVRARFFEDLFTEATTGGR